MHFIYQGLLHPAKKYFIRQGTWDKHIYGAHTNKVLHHLRSVVWCGGDAQELLSFSHSGVVDCLDVDVVTRHHDITDLSVLLCICNLPNR